MDHAASIAGEAFVVTGGCGFIGARVVSTLLQRGAARVVAIDHMKSGEATRLPADSRIEVVNATLGDSSVQEIEAVLRGTRGVFHLAAEKHKPSLGSPRDLVLTNVLGTRDVIEASRRAGVSKVVFSSSLYAYGRMSGPPMVETESPAPRTLYGVTKLAGENLVLAAHHEGSLAGVVLRYFFAYGEAQHAGAGYKSVIVSNFERILRGEAPVVVGDGEQSLDYTYVGEIAEATVRAMERDVAGEVLNIGSGVATSVNELTRRMIRVAGVETAPMAARPDSTHGSVRVADTRLARAKLQFAPSVTLDEGLRRTWDAMKSEAIPARSTPPVRHAGS
jgi:UDP-glucose 4-epimerase